jgi:hypothetical protein
MAETVHARKHNDPTELERLPRRVSLGLIFLNAFTGLDATEAGLCYYLILFFGVVITALALRVRPTTFTTLRGSRGFASAPLITFCEEHGCALRHTLRQVQAAFPLVAVC